MYWMSYLYGDVPCDGDFNGPRWQMRHWSIKMYFVRDMRFYMPCGCDCTWCAIIKLQANDITTPPGWAVFYSLSKNIWNICANSAAETFVVIKILASVSVLIQRGWPYLVMRLLGLNVVESKPHLRARLEQLISLFLAMWFIAAHSALWCVIIFPSVVKKRIESIVNKSPI